MNIDGGYLLHVDVDSVHNAFLESHEPTTLVCVLDFIFYLQIGAISLRECSTDGASEDNQSDRRALSRRTKVFTLRQWRVYTGDLFAYCIDLKLLASCVNCC